jgi:iron complex transport system substrate-binding protein
LLAFFSVCSGADENKPLRIVSLGPAITENLYILGAGDRIVADTVFCRRPGQATNRQKIGSVVRVDVEKIISLKPDLVVATPLTNPEQIKMMRNAGLNVAVLPSAKNFEGLCAQFMKLAELAGRREYAEKVIEKYTAEIDAIRNATKHLGRQKVFVQLGADPLFTATKDSFVNDFVEFSGGINIAGDSDTGMYSREKVIRDNPQVILIVTMGITGEKEKAVWLKYTTIDAVKNNRIFIIDSYKVCSPTPLSFAEALKEVTAYLHPGAEATGE